MAKKIVVVGDNNELPDNLSVSTSSNIYSKIVEKMPVVPEALPDMDVTDLNNSTTVPKVPSGKLISDYILDKLNSVETISYSRPGIPIDPSTPTGSILVRTLDPTLTPENSIKNRLSGVNVDEFKELPVAGDAFAAGSYKETPRNILADDYNKAGYGFSYYMNIVAIGGDISAVHINDVKYPLAASSTQKLTIDGTPTDITFGVVIIPGFTDTKFSVNYVSINSTVSTVYYTIISKECSLPSISNFKKDASATNLVGDTFKDLLPGRFSMTFFVTTGTIPVYDHGRRVVKPTYSIYINQLTKVQPNFPAPYVAVAYSMDLDPNSHFEVKLSDLNTQLFL